MKCLINIKLKGGIFYSFHRILSKSNFRNRRYHLWIKKGITLVEATAALVLFGIVAALVSTILTTIIRANKDIQISTQANQKAII